MANVGWIGLHRKITEHWIFPHLRKFTEFEAWIYLLLHASFADSKVKDGNQLIFVKRGELLTSEQKLGYLWLWDRDKVRKFLKLLQTDGMISKNSNQKFTIITICNYDSYQDFTTAKQQQANSTTTADQQHRNTLEEGKEDKEDKKSKEDGKAIRFIPPTLEMVINKMTEKLDDFTAQGEAQKFISYYESNGWKVGKNKMKSWEAAAAGWVSRMSENKNFNNGTHQQPFTASKQSRNSESVNALLGSLADDFERIRNEGN